MPKECVNWTKFLLCKIQPILGSVTHGSFLHCLTDHILFFKASQLNTCLAPALLAFFSVCLCSRILQLGQPRVALVPWAGLGWRWVRDDVNRNVSCSPVGEMRLGDHRGTPTPALGIAHLEPLG